MPQKAFRFDDESNKIHWTQIAAAIPLVPIMILLGVVMGLLIGVFVWLVVIVGLTGVAWEVVKEMITRKKKA